MYLPIPSQPNCTLAWLAAVKKVDGEHGHTAHNVIIDVENPTAEITLSNLIVATVDDFLRQREKSVMTVANTIFPLSIYRRHGAPKFFQVFHEQILPKVRLKERWSGYYFERMTDFPARSGARLNLLWDIVERLKDFDASHAYNKYEMTIFDPERDIDRSRYGGQCLSFLSFKVLPGETKRLSLTAVYRNHFYIEKLLGNLIGLGRLIEFVAVESGMGIGPLTVISTHAEIDRPRGSTRADVQALVQKCEDTAKQRRSE